MVIRSGLVVALAALFIGVTACKGSGSDGNLPEGNDYDFAPIIADSVYGVILPTYENLMSATAALLAKVGDLQDQADLEEARDLWRAARVPWEQSEAFLFGPVSDLGLDPALDSWPVDRVQLDQVLASRLELTPDTIASNLGGGLKGFHTVEYLLFGDGGSKTIDELLGNTREMEYLLAVTEALFIDCETLYLSWADEGDAFGETFAKSGQAGGRYYAAVDAVQQLVNGCADIADEVANGKIADPFKEGDKELVESQFSYNSLQDFADNMRSIENIYNGIGGSLGISSYVAGRDATLDARVKAEIQASIDAIVAISPDNDPTFSVAITEPAYASAIENAQAAIRTLMDTFKGDVLNSLYN